MTSSEHITEKRSPGLAALFSFLIAGAGQIYNGQLAKGLVILLTGWLILPWLYGIFDAHQTAKRINQGEIKPSFSSGCATTAIVIAGLVFISIAIIGILAAIIIPSFIKARPTKTVSIGASNEKENFYPYLAG